MTEHKVIYPPRERDLQFRLSAGTPKVFATDLQPYAQRYSLRSNSKNADGGSPLLHFFFGSRDLHNAAMSLLRQPNWDPLLDKLKTLNDPSCVIKVSVGSAVNNSQTVPTQLRPLFRDMFFQAAKENTKIRTIIMNNVDFTNHAEGFLTLLGGESNITNILLDHCIDYSPDRQLATILRCTTSLQTLQFTNCRGDLMIPILHKLSSSNCLPRLKTIVWKVNNRESLQMQEPCVEAWSHFLQSDLSSVQCFELHCCYMQNMPPRIIRPLLEGLRCSKSVSDVRFFSCWILNHDIRMPPTATEELASSFADLLLTKTNLATLRIQLCDFFLYRSISQAIINLLIRRDSPLRRMDLNHRLQPDIFYHTIAEANAYLPDGRLRAHRCWSLSLGNSFQELLDAIKRSSQLETFNVGCLRNETHVAALIAALPEIRVKAVSLGFQRVDMMRDEKLLRAFRDNYTIVEAHCWLEPMNRNTAAVALFGTNAQSLLEFYLLRNQKLADWAENPKVVPRELWPKALHMAKKAGLSILHATLMSLMEHTNGRLQQKSRKRKR